MSSNDSHYTRSITLERNMIHLNPCLSLKKFQSEVMDAIHTGRSHV